MDTKAILLVEDNPSDIELTKRALRKNHVGNDLIVVQDGQEALDLLLGAGAEAGHERVGQIALVLLDLHLPKVDGLEVLRRIRAEPRTHRLPVVVLTSSKEQQDLAESYDRGANSYIRKPVDFNQFVHAVGQLGLYWLVLNECPPPAPEAPGDSAL